MDEDYIPPTTTKKSNVESTEEKPKRRRARKSNNAVKVKSDDDKNGDSNSNDNCIPLAQLKAFKNQATIDTIKQVVDVEEGDYIAVMYGYRWYPVRVTKVQGETAHPVHETSERWLEVGGAGHWNYGEGCHTDEDQLTHPEG